MSDQVAHKEVKEEKDKKKLYFNLGVCREVFVPSEHCFGLFSHHCCSSWVQSWLGLIK